MKARVDYLNVQVSNYTSLIKVTDDISKGTHVLIDDVDNFKKYLKTLQFRRIEEFYLSTPITIVPAGWILPKNLNPDLKEKIILNLQWLIDLGHYRVQDRAVGNGLFNQLGKFKDFKNKSLKPCRGQPKDRRNVSAMSLRPPSGTKIPKSFFIKQPKLSITHLKNVFLVLIFGYVLSIFAFFIEIMWFNCSENSLLYKLRKERIKFCKRR